MWATNALLIVEKDFTNWIPSSPMKTKGTYVKNCVVFT